MSYSVKDITEKVKKLASLKPSTSKASKGERVTYERAPSPSTAAGSNEPETTSGSQVYSGANEGLNTRSGELNQIGSGPLSSSVPVGGLELAALAGLIPNERGEPARYMEDVQSTSTHIGAVAGQGGYRLSKVLWAMITNPGLAQISTMAYLASFTNLLVTVLLIQRLSRLQQSRRSFGQISP